MEQGLRRALLGGVAGAVTLTAIHQLAARVLEDAPRMDIVAVRGIKRIFGASTGESLHSATAHRLALAGDLVANSAYYTLVAASPSGAWLRGTLLGAGAGAGALLLPQRMGLGEPPHVESTRNRVLTIAWYLAGGLAAAAVSHGLARKRDGRRAPD